MHKPPEEYTCTECGAEDCEQMRTSWRFEDENGNVRWLCLDCYEQHEREWEEKERAEREAEKEAERERKRKAAADREMSKTYYNDYGGYDWNNREA